MSADIKHPCGCHVAPLREGENYQPAQIVFCELHGSAPALLTRLTELCNAMEALPLHSQETFIIEQAKTAIVAAQPKGN